MTSTQPCPYDIVAEEVNDLLKEFNVTYPSENKDILYIKSEIYGLRLRIDTWKRHKKCGACTFCKKDDFEHNTDEYENHILNIQVTAFEEGYAQGKEECQTKLNRILDELPFIDGYGESDGKPLCALSDVMKLVNSVKSNKIKESK